MFIGHGMFIIQHDLPNILTLKQIVAADEAVANAAATEAQSIKDECEADLAEAIPALEAAIDALNTLKPAVSFNICSKYIVHILF